MSENEDFNDTEAEAELSVEQKVEIAKWFLLNSPAGEIQYVSKDIRAVLNDENVYTMAAEEAFPLYNKSHLICLQLPDRTGDVLITSFGEISKNEYIDPRTANVAIVDHVKQVCKEVRPASDEELPSAYVEDYRCALEAEATKYVSEAYPKGVCAVYCTKGKDVEEQGSNFELVVVISAARHSPQNFCFADRCTAHNDPLSPSSVTIEEATPLAIAIWHHLRCGRLQQLVTALSHHFRAPSIAKHQCPSCRQSNGSWRSIWTAEFKDELQMVEVRGRMQVGAHYFEEGNVQFDAKHECKDTTLIQSPDDSALSLVHIIRQHETEYLNSLQKSYLNLSDTTFKDLRRKLPVTRTLFPWHNTMQFNLVKDISKELGVGK
nr:F-actin-capping protein subunit alpha isoform X1 [Ipomoea trifida]